MTKQDRAYFYSNAEKWLDDIVSHDNDAGFLRWQIQTENNVLVIKIEEDSVKEKSPVLSVYGRYDELIPGRMNCKSNFHSTWNGVDSFEQFVSWLTAAMQNKPY